VSASPLKQLLRHTGAASAIEFGIVAPAFLMSVLGIFWFGWSMHNASSLTYALDQAGRALQINPALNQSALQTLVATKLGEISDVAITVNLAVGAEVNGTQLATISGSYARAIDVPFIPPIEYRITRQVTVPVRAN
jgi:Flp pilus assembly protein TadG